MEKDDVLSAFHETNALLSGHFELRSGLHSNEFFQCALLLQRPRIAEKLCAKLAKSMQDAAVGGTANTVVAPALGGIPVGHEIARALDLRSIFVEKKNDVLELRRFSIEKGERFIVAEDVMTRGGRIQETIDIVQENGGIVEAVLVLVDRSGGKVQFDAPIFSLLQIEPTTWNPDECPLCKEGVALVHPGS